MGDSMRGYIKAAQQLRELRNYDRVCGESSLWHNFVMYLAREHFPTVPVATEIRRAFAQMLLATDATPGKWEKNENLPTEKNPTKNS